jgi:hypothetical protein
MSAALKLVEKEGMENKNKALDAALAQIERAFGKGSIMKLGQREALEIEAVSTGSLAPTTLPGGVKTRLPLLPFQMFGWRPPLLSDPPEVGQHNDEVLTEIGYDKAGIAALKAAHMLGPK